MASRKNRDLYPAVRDRARGFCEYCHREEELSGGDFIVEHIYPESKGGPTELDNLALACQDCNNHKYTKTTAIDPETQQHVPLFHPRTQNWLDHFTWSEDLLEIQGITTIGRATVVTLKLNRNRLCQQRRILKQIGEHPTNRWIPT